MLLSFIDGLYWRITEWYPQCMDRLILLNVLQQIS